MNFKDVLIEFAEASGRRDLVGENGEDLGGGRFVNAAQRWLDQKQTTPKSSARHSIALAAGAYYTHVRGLRVIEEVWIATATTRYRLARRDADWLRARYSGLLEGIDETLRPPIQSVAITGTGTPYYWAIVPVGLSPRQNFGIGEPDDFGFRHDLDAIAAGDHYDLTGLLIMPPTDEARTLTIVGRFWSPWLKNADDKSYWTMEQPTALVMAACYMLENYYRNTAGANDYRNMIEDLLSGVHRDMSQQDCTEVFKMEG